MIETMVHFHGTGHKQRHLPAMPRPGDYIQDEDGSLWVVSAVVFGSATIDVYAVGVADARTKELTTEWSAWHEATAVVEPAQAQRGLW
jgi:hypothetical protein